MLQFPHPCSRTRQLANAAVLCIIAALCACTNGAGSGARATGNISINSLSPPTYSVTGTISGLNSSGLVLMVASQRRFNTPDLLPMTGAISFPARTSNATPVRVSAGQTSLGLAGSLPAGSGYSVTVQTQPVGETCTVAGGSGTVQAASTANVVVSCADLPYPLGGTLSGLTGSGLVLGNGVDTLALQPGATSFTMPAAVNYGSAYAVTVQSQPAALVCPVSNGTGVMGAAGVTNIAIACVSNFSLLYSFAGGSDAADPYHTLIQDSDGNFYGTTLTGGVKNAGTVYKIAPNGTEAVFYSFASTPYSGLVQGSDNDIYGTTAGGGVSGRGTVFKITPAGTATVLFSFPAGSSDPYTGLIQGSDGNFYGTTGAGGTNDDGTVFKITPSGTETVLHTFAKTGTDGQTPYAGLLQGSDGNFYGTTYFGGSNGFGTVFKVTPAGVETVLYSFAAGGDGQHPYAGLIQGSDGNFYGTTYQGGAGGLGTIYRITPGGTEAVLHSFIGGNSDGASPEAGLTLGSDGNYYGNTFQGGAAGLGTVFKFTRDGTETILHVFAGSTDGANPSANLVQGADGSLYGSSGAGGAGGHGTFFKIALH